MSTQQVHQPITLYPSGGSRRVDNNIQDVRLVDSNGEPIGGGTGSGGISIAPMEVSRGVAGAPFSSADASGAVANVSDLPATGKKLVVTDIRYSVDTDMQVDFYDVVANTVILSEFVSAKAPVQISTQGKLKLATVNSRLGVKTSAAGNIKVLAFYYSE